MGIWIRTGSGSAWISSAAAPLRHSTPPSPCPVRVFPSRSRQRCSSWVPDSPGCVGLGGGAVASTLSQRLPFGPLNRVPWRALPRGARCARGGVLRPLLVVAGELEVVSPAWPCRPATRPMPDQESSQVRRPQRGVSYDRTCRGVFLWLVGLLWVVWGCQFRHSRRCDGCKSLPRLRARSRGFWPRRFPPGRRRCAANAEEKTSEHVRRPMGVAYDAGPADREHEAYGQRHDGRPLPPAESLPARDIDQHHGKSRRGGGMAAGEAEGSAVRA